MTDRLKTALEMRLTQTVPGAWLFPNPDARSGHIEESSLSSSPKKGKKNSAGGPHQKAMALSGVLPFELYTLRHTCLTNWGEYMDPFRLKKYAGHRDLKTTRRYVHPRDESTEEAMARARAAREVRAATRVGILPGIPSNAALQATPQIPHK
jgi:integrase